MTTPTPIEAGARAMKQRRRDEIEGRAFTSATYVEMATLCIEAAIATGSLNPASAVADMRERCAKVADEAATHMADTGEMHPEDSGNRDRCFARSREATQIASAIRSLDLSPAGVDYVVVPREPTEDMANAAECAQPFSFEAMWKAAIAEYERSLLNAATGAGDSTSVNDGEG